MKLALAVTWLLLLAPDSLPGVPWVPSVHAIALRLPVRTDCGEAFTCAYTHMGESEPTCYNENTVLELPCCYAICRCWDPEGADCTWDLTAEALRGRELSSQPTGSPRVTFQGVRLSVLSSQCISEIHLNLPHNPT